MEALYIIERPWVSYVTYTLSRPVFFSGVTSWIGSFAPANVTVADDAGNIDVITEISEVIPINVFLIYKLVIKRVKRA